MVSEEQKKEYQDYVKEITPTHNTPRNIFRAFWTGGTVCVIGQILSVFFEKMGMGKEAAGTWTSIALVLAAIILTGLHLFGRLTKYAGAGLLVPITGFAKGAGVDIAEVNRLVKQFEQSRKLMKQMSGMMSGKRSGGGLFGKLKLPF